jgi:fructan beta-fructosidase
MLVSLYGSAPKGGSGAQYFIGDFDGRRFTNSQSPQTICWLDYGRDNYAGVTFSDIPEEDGRRLFLAWMSNWWYAETTPTAPWRGAMTIPRELRLTTAHSGNPQLISLPVVELQSLRQKYFQIEPITISDSTTFAGANSIIRGAFEIQIAWELATASEFGLRLKNNSGDETMIGYDVEGRRAFVNRQRSGLVDFYPDFAGYQHSAKLLPLANTITFHIFVDHCSIEVFANDGRLVITDLIFPTSEINQLELYAQNGAVHLRNFAVWAIKTTGTTATGVNELALP